MSVSEELIETTGDSGFPDAPGEPEPQEAAGDEEAPGGPDSGTEARAPDTGEAGPALADDKAVPGAGVQFGEEEEEPESAREAFGLPGEPTDEEVALVRVLLAESGVPGYQLGSIARKFVVALAAKDKVIYPV